MRQGGRTGAAWLAAAFICAWGAPAGAHVPAREAPATREDPGAGGETSPDRLPDLISDAPENPVLEETTEGSGDGSTRRLLRFDGFVHNRSGAGPLGFYASGPASLAMSSVIQTVQRENGTWRDQPSAAQILWETADGHTHWHLKNIARYSLVQADSPAEVAPAMKTGFCLMDSLWAQDHDKLGDDDDPQFYGYWPPAPEGEPARPGHVYTSCESPATQHGRGQTAPDLTMGVSAGWIDVYGSSLFFQWVDVSDTAPGRYRLAAEMDPESVVLETDEVNPPAYKDVVIPGHVPTPADHQVSLGGSRTIQLASEEVKVAGEKLGDPVYRIEQLPEHGRLLDAEGDEVRTGKWLRDRFVTYIPDPALAEPVYDELHFTVHESIAQTSVVPFPRNPPRATVTFDVGDVTAERVTISGEKDVVAGTSQLLSAAVRNADAEAVAWSVVTPGGGTIDATGLYTAPAAVTAPETVSVRAALPSGTYDEVTFVVTPRPPDEPAPGTETPDEVLPAVPQTILPPPPPAPPAPPADPVAPQSPPPGPTVRGPVTKPLPSLSLRTARNGRRVTARVVSKYSGRITLSLLRGPTRIGRCTITVRAQRSYSCQLSAGRHTGPLRVTASLKRTTGQVLTRTAAVKAASAKR